MLQPPGAATTHHTPDYQCAQSEDKGHTFVVAWDVAPRARISLGYRYRSRIIIDAGGDFIPIHRNRLLFGAVLRPTPQWRVTFNISRGVDNFFTRISLRQMQQLSLGDRIQSASLAGALLNDQHPEDHEHCPDGTHLAHNRDFSFSTAIHPAKGGAST